MAPLIEVSDETIKTLNPKVYTLRKDLEDQDNFIYVPSINLHVAKERTQLGENWFECQKNLHARNQKMLNPKEFTEFLKYTKENERQIYEEITAIKNPWRAEWIDADFKVNEDNLYINYHIFGENGDILEKSEKLGNKTLMQDKSPGISLEDWINNPTNQGLLSNKTKSGNLYYWAPMKDNNSVARFGADSGNASLDCNRYPSGSSSDLGVRVAEQRA